MSLTVCLPLRRNLEGCQWQMSHKQTSGESGVALLRVGRFSSTWLSNSPSSGSPLIFTTTALAGSCSNLLRVEEFANECHRFRSALFHQPVLGATDDRLLNIG